jgi:hypothetical protein
MVSEVSARNVIRGLENAYWGEGHHENSVMGSVAAAMHAIGDRTPYHYLMGVSGGAFRIQMAQPGMCPSSPHANCGFNLIKTLVEALPYEFVSLDKGEESAEGRRAPQELIESIDQGVPAFYGHEEQSLIVGYDKQGREVLLRKYGAKKVGYEPHSVDELLSSWAGLHVMRKKDEAPDRRKALIRSLEIALQVAHTPAYDKYASGFAAYEFWIERLRSGTEIDFAEMIANGHGFYSLVDARSSAVQYLNEIAGQLSGDAEKHLKRAAEHYAEIVQVLTRRSLMETAPKPWMPQAKGWSQDDRNQQADLLEESLGIERQAVAELEAALQSLKTRRD